MEHSSSKSTLQSFTDEHYQNLIREPHRMTEAKMEVNNIQKIVLKNNKTTINKDLLNNFDPDLTKNLEILENDFVRI